MPIPKECTSRKARRLHTWYRGATLCTTCLSWCDAQLNLMAQRYAAMCARKTNLAHKFPLFMITAAPEHIQRCSDAVQVYGRNLLALPTLSSYRVMPVTCLSTNASTSGLCACPQGIHLALTKCYSTITFRSVVNVLVIKPAFKKIFSLMPE